MKSISLALLLIFGSVAFAQQINFEEFNHNFKTNSKPIILYFYTDWCAYCKIQDKENKSIEDKNESFYFLKFNAESSEKINFLGRNFKPNSTKTRLAEHDFIKAFLKVNEQINYPYWVILNQEQEIIGKYSGLLKKKKLEEIINKIKMGTL